MIHNTFQENLRKMCVICMCTLRLESDPLRVQTYLAKKADYEIQEISLKEWELLKSYDQVKHQGKAAKEATAN